MEAPLRVMTLIEGASITGPLRALLDCSRFESTGTDTVRVLRTVVTTSRRNAPPRREFLDAVAAADLPVEMLDERHAFDLEPVSRLSELMRRAAPDIVESHSYKLHALAWLARQRLGNDPRPAWIAFHHGYTRETWRVRCYNQFDRLTLRFADHVVTVCNSFADTLRGRGVGAARISVLHNALAEQPKVTANESRNLRAALGISASDLVVLSVGRLSSEKGHADLVTAFASVLVRTRREDVRLVIVGDGIELRRLRALAQPLGSRVIFAGQQPDIRLWFGIADIFALPSHSEGSPLALLEAMQAGLPIVATSVGGIPEMIDDRESALLVPARDRPALAAALAALFNDATRRAVLGEAAFLRCRRYSPAARGSALLELYRMTAKRASQQRS